jgi:uncharacterized protein (DUF305 family)
MIREALRRRCNRTREPEVSVRPAIHPSDRYAARAFDPVGCTRMRTCCGFRTGEWRDGRARISIRSHRKPDTRSRESCFVNRWHPLTLLAAGLFLCGCASGSGTREPEQTPAAPSAAQPTPAHDAMPMHDMHGALEGLPATAGPGYAVADVRFMQGMIGHHAQAVTMSKWAPTHDAGESLLKLAEKIRISQTDEIALMKNWLRERGQAVPSDERIAAMRMPGMLTDEQMKQLEAARGTEFDRLYLAFMIQHHRGALTMVSALDEDPAAAQDPDIFRFITDVDFDQRNEIWVMQTMLNTIVTNRRGPSR